MDASASSASESAATIATRHVLDKCWRHLEAQGFGTLELATLHMDDCEEIAKQLAFELNLPYSESIVDAMGIEVLWCGGQRFGLVPADAG